MLHVASSQLFKYSLLRCISHLYCCSPEHVNLQFSKKAVAKSKAYECSTQGLIKDYCSQAKDWPNSKIISQFRSQCLHSADICFI